MGLGLLSGWETKIPQVHAWPKKKKKPKNSYKVAETPTQAGLNNERYMSLSLSLSLFWLTELKNPEQELAFNVF